MADPTLYQTLVLKPPYSVMALVNRYSLCEYNVKHYLLTKTNLIL
jgi:hypothetical protein